PFVEESIGEMACVAVHPEYRSSSRGDQLLHHIAAQARQQGLKRLFVLTTHSIHWFQERGFLPAEIAVLPRRKQELYNYQRRSKILVTDL
ncbi:GNAT family N-acetyltransferase, partial [Musicola paradisiaca]